MNLTNLSRPLKFMSASKGKFIVRISIFVGAISLNFDSNSRINKMSLLFGSTPR
jgi:hypothetical protein